MLGSLDDGEKFRELVPLPTLPRVAVQGHFLLETQQARATSGKGAAGEEHAGAAAVPARVRREHWPKQTKTSTSSLSFCCTWYCFTIDMTGGSIIYWPNYSGTVSFGVRGI